MTTTTLPALVQNLTAISATAGLGATADGSRSDESPFQTALRAMWGGDSLKAAELAASLLADEPECEERFAAYRLWIEALADQADRDSLKAVRDHLFLRGQADPTDHETYCGLRGVAHLELDELDAARLLARAMTDCTHNPYCLEVVQRVEERGAIGPVPALLRATIPLTDYFHWQTVSRGLLKLKAQEPLAEVLAFVQEQYRGSSLPHLFEYHRCIDASFYAGAAMVAQRLTELYPSNVDFRYYHAYALFEDGDYPGARRLLNETLRLVGDTDPEIVGLLGHCNAKLGDAEKAATYLRRAVQLLEEQGLPTSHVSLELANVEEELRGDAPDPTLELPRASRNWLVRLSPRRYHEFLASSESSIDRLLRPMGKEPQPGDYCFFASTTAPDDQGRSMWRIVAIYLVDSLPMRHPLADFHSALKLVKRLPEGIPVDVQAEDEAETDAMMTHPLGHPLRYGVYEMDGGALGIIEEAARLHREDMIERRRGNTQSRRPTA